MFEALFDRKPVRPFARQQDVRAVFHDRAGQANGVFGFGDSSNRPAPAVAPVHDRGVEFVGAFIGEHGATPGVEMRIIFEHADRRFDGVERTAALFQDGRPRFERQRERGADGFVIFRADSGALDNAGAAMNDKRPFGGGSSSDRHDGRR